LQLEFEIHLLLRMIGSTTGQLRLFGFVFVPPAQVQCNYIISSLSRSETFHAWRD
jgi:hypothetical protein